MADEKDTQASADQEDATTAVGAPAARKGDVEAVGSQSDNEALEHTMGGSTTRDDANDLGVPMLQGSPDEPQGPEDALGEGPTRGDYSGRIGPESYHPHETLIRDGEIVVESQRTRVVQGEVEGKKGGVETSHEDMPSGRRR
jgi:hypothetical protein